MEQRYFPENYFKRLDEGSDHDFYSEPRKVVHIDEEAIAALQAYYAKHVPPHGDYLDLMSSWRSHIPPSLDPISVTGLGMNAEEMGDNPQLDEFIVHDLNVTPMLPYPDNRWDAVLCAVSIQYLQNPIDVFRHVNRTLKPDGIFIVSFSNRCFPTKAISIWLNMNEEEQVELVKRYFELAGNFTDIQTKAITPDGQDPLYIVSGRKALDL
ncbi:methyltransferase domain-containing protein [Phototrophicus methaneseepsis]|uniref:Methyltransferase domain-containing protein n=1 Tax=Phototrophicus methaneseepsis TaxID=2710758 RepID=A0A7S8E724_9CHLR|nr:methyltransferase domain-containing protein [Phototrophicus methaneseepsis]QPC81549.1 methyltransferase domain-containing protein [Phototrophicus methaneseepsis]